MTFSFSDPEAEVLRRILLDWIEEGFTTPPYEPAMYDVFEKLLRPGDRERLRAGYSLDRPSAVPPPG